MPIHKGRFAAHLAGGAGNVGGVSGRTGSFNWKLSGRFTAGGMVVVRSAGHTISRGETAHPAPAELTLG